MELDEVVDPELEIPIGATKYVPEPSSTSGVGANDGDHVEEPTLPRRSTRPRTTPECYCRGIVESSRGRGAIELGRERGFGVVG